MTLLILILPSIRTTPHPTPLELHLETPVWAHNQQRLQRLFVFTAMTQGIFVLTAWNTSVLTATNMPLVTLSTVACATTVLFATILDIPPTTVQIDSAPSVMTQDMSSQIVPSLRTPAVVSSSTMETQWESSLVLVVQIFKGGNVMIQGDGLLFSIICLPLLSSNSPLTFTISIMFLTDTY